MATDSMVIDVEKTLAKLTVPQKVKLLAGLGWWHTECVPEAGIQPIRMSDGPNGVRGTRFFNGVPSSCFPSSTGLGSSFDIDLAEQVGKALADECIAKSTHILLGPTVNTQRSPLGGRGFESFSEDPHLNGTIAAAYINGLQSKKVAATIKHFVANDQEYQRFSIDSVVSERALREIYLKPFQIAMKKSKPVAFMTAYNRVNGTHASEHPWLLQKVLREEWGFKGLVMSDWTGVYSTTESIKAGVDVEMPGPTIVRGAALERALTGEKLFIEDINERVRKVLELYQYAQRSGIPFNGPEEGIDTPALRALLRRAAADAVVLLKNDASPPLLPLKKGIKTIAVLGPNAKQAFTSGGGSARLLETYSVSPLAGIRAAAEGIGATVKYAVGAMTHKYLPVLDGYIKWEDQAGAFLEFWNAEPGSAWLLGDGDGPKPDWSTRTRGSYCNLMDGVDNDKVNVACWIRYRTIYTPDESGDFEFEVTMSGAGALFVNDKLVADLTQASPADGAIFSAGSADAIVVVQGLTAGSPVSVEVRSCNAEFIAKGTPWFTRGSVRVGAFRKVGKQQAIDEAVAVAKDADVAIVVVGLNHEWESEGFDRPNMSLPGASHELISAVLTANPKTIIVNQSGTPVHLHHDGPTILQAFYGGNELGNGLADVLFGVVNPSGKLALSWPKELEDNPSYGSFADDSERYGNVLYNEGIYVGYRTYDKKNITPLFPFGYGLSYTTFEYSALQITPIVPDGTLSVSFTIKNTGAVAGREIAQVYVSDPVSSAPRPVRELKGFIKVSLEPGESKATEVALERDALSWWDERHGVWTAEKGEFVVDVGASSRDLKLKGTVQLAETFTWTGL